MTSPAGAGALASLLPPSQSGPDFANLDSSSLPSAASASTPSLSQLSLLRRRNSARLLRPCLLIAPTMTGPASEVSAAPLDGIAMATEQEAATEINAAAAAASSFLPSLALSSLPYSSLAPPSLVAVAAVASARVSFTDSLQQHPPSLLLLLFLPIASS